MLFFFGVNGHAHTGYKAANVQEKVHYVFAKNARGEKLKGSQLKTEPKADALKKMKEISWMRPRSTLLRL